MAGIADPGHGHVSLEPMNLSPRFDEVAGKGDSPLWRRRAHEQTSRPSLAAGSGLVVGAGVNTPPPRRPRSLWQQLTPEDPPSDPPSDSSPSAATGTGLPSRSASATDAIGASAPLSAAASRSGRSSAAPGGRKRTPLPRPKENASAPADVGGSTGRKRTPPLGGRGASAGGKRSRLDEVLASAKAPAAISASNVKAAPKRRSSTIIDDDEDVEVIFTSSVSIVKKAAKKRVAFSSDDEGEVKPPTTKPSAAAKVVLRANVEGGAKPPPKTNVTDARAKAPAKAVAVRGPVAVGGGPKKRPATAFLLPGAAAQACNAKDSGRGQQGRGLSACSAKASGRGQQGRGRGRGTGGGRK